MEHLHTRSPPAAHLEWVDVIHTNRTAQDTDAGARKSAAAEERRLWLLIADPQTPPTERVKAYAGWLRTTAMLRELGPAPESPQRPGSPA